VAADHPSLAQVIALRSRLGALLLREGRLNEDQLAEALAEHSGTGRRLGEIVLERGWVSAEGLARALAQQYDLEFLDLAGTEVDETLAALLPEKFARLYGAMPVRNVDGTIQVAVADPTDLLASDDLRLALGGNIRLAVVVPEELEHAIARAYRVPEESDDNEPRDEDDEGPSSVYHDIGEAADVSAPAIKLVNTLLTRAADEGASDIHFEPQAKHLMVRARIDGTMRPLKKIPKSVQPAVTSRLKVMGALDIADRRTPQDGRVTVRFDGQTLDLRMAVLPTAYGEQIALRIVHRAARLALSELGMSPEAETSFARAVGQPYGAVVACGPTGSGKTTTLYAALEQLNDSERVLMTIEDPVEYQMPGVTQVEVNPKAGLTFGSGLRTILRSDPDVLLVGEIRDEETARIAMQAAMTGHLVLTSLHSHNAASAIARLKAMGVEPSILATTINCIVAQRLARRLCTDCKEAYAPEDEEKRELGVDADADLSLYRARGCGRCARTGYRGRVALYEVMPVQGRIRRLIEASTEEIFAAAVEDGMQTLRQDGIRLCLDGVASLDEIRRVTGDRLV
jgi:type IV pilus assembly protein PilB